MTQSVSALSDSSRLQMSDKTSMMEVIINNQPREIPEETTLEALLQLLDMEAKGIAVAINKQVVPKKQWEATRLQSRDEVLLIRASQGG
jgi:sulfur carrier protein